MKRFSWYPYKSTDELNKMLDSHIIGPIRRAAIRSPPSDMRMGPYARGDVLELLRRDLAAVLSRAGTQAGPGNNIVPFRGDLLRVARAEIRDVAAVALDVDYGPVVKPAAKPQAERAPELQRALAALPDDLMEPALQAFRDYLGKHAGGGGLTAGDVEAFVAEGMRELHAFQTAHLEGRSPGSGALAGLKGLALIGALAVAYGAEVMTSGFAFGDMIRADALNWPLAFTGSFLFGGGLIAMSETDKQRQFWGRVGLAWALTVSSLAATNRTIVDPLQGRSVFLAKALLPCATRRTC